MNNRRMVWSIIVLLCLAPVSLFLLEPDDSCQLDETMVRSSSDVPFQPDVDHSSISEYPGYFIENQGQIDNIHVRFYSPGGRTSIGLLDDSMVFDIHEREIGPSIIDTTDEGRIGESVTYQVRFKGCNPCIPEGKDLLDHTTTYYMGKDPCDHYQEIPNYAKVRYDELYEGVDLVVYFREGQFKYEFVLQPGVDPSIIEMEFVGIEDLDVCELTGELSISTEIATLRDSRPFTYTCQNGQVLPLGSRYSLDREGMSISYEVDGWRSCKAPIVIDPGLQYSTYLGGSDLDLAGSLTVDNEGNVIVVGVSHSQDFPMTPDAVNTSFQAMFLAKFDSTLSTLLYSTFFGGPHQGGYWTVTPSSLHAREDGNIIFVGRTGSEFYPTTGDAMYSTNNGDRDIVITLFTQDLKTLIYSTYWGGSGIDSSLQSVMDDTGNLFISGHTTSHDLPTTNGAYCRTYMGEWDNFALKLDSSLKNMVYCTYLGGSNSDGNLAVGLAPNGGLVLAGSTRSRDFPTTAGAYCSTYIADDNLYITKINSDGTDLEFSTFFGTGAGDRALVVEVSNQGYVVLFGETESTEHPLKDPIQSEHGGGLDMFLSVFDATGSTLLFSTYYGGSGNDWYCFDAAWNRSDNVIYFSGSTSSDDLLTTPGCYDSTHNGLDDIFILGFDVDDFTYTYSSYFGGERFEYSEQGFIDFDESSGTLWVLGITYSEHCPTTSNAYCQTFNEGTSDTFILGIVPKAVDPPEPPEGLRVTDFGDGYLSLEWEHITAENYELMGYVLYRGTSAEDMEPVTDLTMEIEFHDTGLENGEVYYYGVTGTNSAGEGRMSDPVPAVPMDYPGPPMGLKAELGDGNITLDWDPPLDDGGSLLGYHVLRGPTLTEMVVVESTDDETFTDHGVVPGEWYYYSVRAFNELGNGSLGEPQHIQYLSPPSAPQGLMASPGDRQVVLTWDEPEDLGGARLIGYRIYRFKEGDEWELVAHRLPTEPVLLDTRVENGIPYSYSVSAFTSFMEGPKCGAIEVIPYGVPSTPTDPTARPSDGAVLLEWGPPDNDGGSSVTGYTVSWRVGETGRIDSVSLGTGNTHLMTGLSNGVEYQFAVAASNEAGIGPMTGFVIGIPYGPPGIVTDLSGTPGAAGVILTWSPPHDTGLAPVLSYSVLRGTSTGQLRLISEIDGTTSFLDTEVELGTTYYYAVQAYNPASEGQLSEAVPLFMPNLPGTPFDLTSVAADGEVWLRWSPPDSDGGSDLLGYIVFRGDDIDEQAQIARINVPEYNDPGVVNGQTYYYHIKAINIVGAGEPSVTISTKPMRPPDAPSNFKVVLRDDDIVLTWDTPSGEAQKIIGYNVLRGTSRDQLSTIAELGLVNKFIDKDVPKGRTYYYSVTAQGEADEGESAEPLKLRVDDVWDVSTLLIIILVVIIFVLVAAILSKGREES